MNIKKRLGISIIFTLMLVILITSTASAHFCTPVNKPIGAGSLGTILVSSDLQTFISFTPTKKLNSTGSNGGFMTITDGSTFSYDVFGHVLLPDSARDAGPGSNQCDGIGIDDALVCLGISLE